MESVSAFPYDDIVERLTVRHIQTPFDRLKGFKVEEPAEGARGFLERNRFDYGPVFRNGEMVGRAGVLSLVNSATTVEEGFEPLSQQYLISSGSSIRSVMVWLQHDPWLLVVDGRQITGLVTPSDLNRQAARSYFYLLVADFEIRLADAIRDTFNEQADAFRYLESAEVEGIERRVAKAQKGDIDSDVVAAMYLWNLLKIAAGSSDVRSRVEHVDENDWQWINSHLNKFRRRVMHPVKPLLDDTSGLDDLIEVEGRLRRLAGAGPAGSTKEDD